MAELSFRAATTPLRDRGRLRAVALTALFAALLVFNIWRTLHHAMWRDEMQLFLIGADASSLPELFRNFAYEPHPRLWPLLVWFATRIYADPMSMQVMHALLATCVWLLIWYAAPFPRLDKILLLLGYFFFFEYFVVSRHYVLIALVSLALTAVRTLWPQRVLLSFALLGVLANTMIWGTIWSLVVAARLALERGTPRWARVCGVALYLACFSVAVVSVISPPDAVPYGAQLRFEPSHLGNLASIPAGALFPVNPQWVVQAVRFVLQPGSELPHFWNPTPFYQLLQLAPSNATRIALILALLLSPPLLCWWLVRDRRSTAEFALVYLGIVLFAALWDYPGLSRHHGIVFMALVCVVWIASARAPLTGLRAATWRLLLVISAIGGLTTIGAEARIFSHGRTVAEWLTRNGLADAFIMGSRDSTLSTISGYLGRPLYYLECECSGRFIVWNEKRSQFLDAHEIARRTNRTPLAAGKETILIANRDIPAEVARENAPDRVLTLLHTFAGAEVDSEDYWVFRVTPKR